MSQKVVPTSLATILQAAGLTEKEAIIYETMLSAGAQSASKLATLAGLKRGITYASLAKLKDMGVAFESTRSGVTVYTPSHPSVVLQLIAKRRGELGSVEHLFTQRMPELSKKYKLAVGKPTVRYYEGEEGIREVFEDVYAPKDEPVYGCVDLAHAQKVFPAYISGDVVPKRIKNGVQSIPIFADDTLSRELSKKDIRQLRISALVPGDEYTMPAEIDVYEDKVAMMTFRKGDFVALMIENADIATSLKSIFRLAHAKARELMKKT